MRKSVLLLLLCLPMWLMAESKITVISLELTEAEQNYLSQSGRKPRLELIGQRILDPEFVEAQQDQNGKWYFVLPNPMEQYATMTVWGNGTATIYITPGMETQVYVIPDKGFRYEGDGADINNYLNTAPINAVGSDELKLNEEQFIIQNREALEKACQKLKDAKLDKKFSALEKQRLECLFANKFYMYMDIFSKVNHTAYTPSQEFKEYANGLFHENDELFALSEYKSLAGNIIYSNWKTPIDAQNREDETLSKIKFILDRFKGEKIREYEIGLAVIVHIREAGLQDTARIEPLFRQYVRNPKIIKMHDDFCDKMTSETDKILQQAAQAGNKKCPVFKFKDINGKEVSLEDFKGKYVYIDCWATWCGPCKAELPYLKKLEEKYKDRNIVFVSISSDKDIDAWKKMVKMDKLGGVQLNIGTDQSFHFAMKINTIPRFMLVDPEGNFVSDNAPRPSNSQIETLFNSLEGL